MDVQEAVYEGENQPCYYSIRIRIRTGVRGGRIWLRGTFEMLCMWVQLAKMVS